MGECLEIRLGPAGVPISAKERSSIGGVKRVAELGLRAMEIEFVRGVRMSVTSAKELGKTAAELDVRLSIHAPYYINLTSIEKEKVEASKRMILDSCERGAAMGAKIIVFHAGYYGKLGETCTINMIEALKELSEKVKDKGWDILLAPETTGRLSQWGTLEEIATACKKVKNCVPGLDPAHIFARQGGNINYKKIFDELKDLKLDWIHSHFSGVKYNATGIGKGNERYHLPLKQAKPDFEEFAREILKRKIDITIISESPILEQDSLYMKKILEKLGYKFPEKR